MEGYVLLKVGGEARPDGEGGHVVRDSAEYAHDAYTVSGFKVLSTYVMETASRWRLRAVALLRGIVGEFAVGRSLLVVGGAAH